MIVECDIFSGKRNPSWEIDENQIDNLKQLLSKLKSTSTAVYPNERLSYRGLNIHDPEGKLIVFHKNIVMHLNHLPIYLIDHDRNIENWLLENASVDLELKESILRKVRNSYQYLMANAAFEVQP